MIYINCLSSINPLQGTEIPVAVDGRLSAVEPDYKITIPDAGLRRRMSRVVRMGVASALVCVSRSEAVDAVITATGLGCLGDTEKFLLSVLEHEESLLNPTAFIQSTFNTVGAQIALILKIHGYNVTYTHRGFSFESALLDAMMRLADNESRRVLVGAVDELTPTSFKIMERLGCWKSAIAGEGAQFFVLGKEPGEECHATLEGVDTFLNPMSGPEIQERTGQFLARYGLTFPEVDLLMRGGEGMRSEWFPSAVVTDFKSRCGEYPTAASFAVWLAAGLLKGESYVGIELPSRLQHVLIYNSWLGLNHSLILLKRV